MKKIIPFHKEIPFRTMIGEITSISLDHTLSFKESDSVTGDFIVSGTYKMTEASQIEEPFNYNIPVDITIDRQYETGKSMIDIDDFYYEIINDEILKVNIDVSIDGILEKEEVREASVETASDISALSEEERVANEMLEDVISLDEDIIKSHLEKPIATKIEIDPLEREEDSMNTVSVEKEEMVQPKENISTSVTKEVRRAEKVIAPAKPREDESTEKMSSIFSAFAETEETFSAYSVYIVRESDSLDSILDRYNTTREDLANYNNLDEIKLGTKLIIPCSTILNE